MQASIRCLEKKRKKYRCKKKKKKSWINEVKIFVHDQILEYTSFIIVNRGCTHI